MRTGRPIVCVDSQLISPKKGGQNDSRSPIVSSGVLLFSVLAPVRLHRSALEWRLPPTVSQFDDINAAVNAYLAKMPPAQRARSDAYFEGGYWLILWDFLSTAFVMWLMLHFRWSAKMRNLAERITRFRPLQTVVYWVQFSLWSLVADFSARALYEGYFREHKYGLLNQTFGPWMRDQLVGLAVSLCSEQF